MKAFEEEEEISDAEMEKIQNMDAPFKPPIDPELLRKYVFVAKKRYPIMTEEAMDALKSYYMEVRRLGETDETRKVPITARQLEAFVRVAEASARAQMKDVVTRDDADRAIKIVKEYLRRVVGRGEDELSWDTDSLYTDVPHTQQERVWGVRDIMRDLIRTDSAGFTMNEVVEKAEERGITEDKVTAIWEKMRKDGDIYQQSGKRDGETLFKLTHEL
jgi:replicative DNA helicase Mcm